MNKSKLKIIGYFLLFCISAYVSYPKPIEIILLYVIGMASLILLVELGIRAANYFSADSRQQKLIEYGTLSIFILLFFSFMTMLFASFDAKKIVWNVIQTHMTPKWIVIDIFILLVFVLHWTTSKDQKS